MTFPGVLDATVRSLLVSGVGVLVLGASPTVNAGSGTALPHGPVPTVLGLGLMLAGWFYFTVSVAWPSRTVQPEWVPLTLMAVQAVALAGVIASVVLGAAVSGGVLVLVAFAAQVLLAVRARRGALAFVGTPPVPSA